MAKEETREQTKKRWADEAKKHLVGKKIIEVRYLNEEECKGMGWSEAPLAIFFEDGSYIFPSQDDEGNGGGSLFTSFKEMPIIPVIW